MGLLTSARFSRLFFQERLRAGGTVAPKSLRARLHQRIFERGCSVPWVFTPAGCAAYWDVPAGREGAANRPEDYAFGPVGIMTCVLERIAGRVGHDEPVLEIGCNAGSKLEQLRLAGFTRLAGVDINAACFEVMERAFPELHAQAELHAGPADEVLPRLETGRFALVYSISSLQHVHPRHSRVFDEIARICRNLLVTVEIEWAGGPYFFPRNYRRVFDRRGFTQLSSSLISPELCPAPELADYWGHVLRVFGRRR